MQFSTVAQIKRTVDKLRQEKTSRNMHYPVLFKKALCEFIRDNNDITAHSIEHQIGIKASNIYNWIQQFNDNLFNIEGTYNVSRKSQKLNHKILDMLNQQREQLVRKIELVEQATAMGLTVSET